MDKRQEQMEAVTDSNVQEALAKMSTEDRAELSNLEARLESLQYPSKAPTEVLDIRLHIVNAFTTEIREDDELKDVVIFLCEDAKTSDLFTVMQTANPVRETFSQMFNMYRANGIDRRLEDRCFSELEGVGKAGNTAIVVKRWQAELKSANPPKAKAQTDTVDGN